MRPYLDDGDVRLYLGDCVEVMAGMDPESIDAVVCDPPYGLDFMGRAWDTGAVAFAVETWREALRVLRPGGHLLAFGGTRTFHRLTCAIEDAGFEVRDCMTWLYGSGFPKSLDVSKAIDKATASPERAAWLDLDDEDAVAVPEPPADPRVAEHAGKGTALKPAYEPIVVARKPLAGTVAANVLAHGTGALNIDASRIAHASDADRAESEGKNQHTRYANPGSNRDSYSGSMPARTDYSGADGRWPANVVLTHSAGCDAECEPDCPVRMLDEQAGESVSSPRPRTSRVSMGYGGQASDFTTTGHADTGGPSRFFYTAKASTAERDGATHPTVKPLALMRWLVRMVTPPGGLVLDPFAGSGTTLLAAREEGLRAVGIEREAEYAQMAAHRLRQLSLLGGAA